MDDSAQNSSDAGNISVGQQASQEQLQQPLSQQQASLMGSFAKEQAPVTTAPLPETGSIEPSEKAPQLPKEVAEAGVEIVKPHDVPQLTLEDKKAGLTPAPVIALVPTQPTDNIVLPMTGEQATQVVKTNKKPNNSIVWLAISVLRQLKMLHTKGEG